MRPDVLNRNLVLERISWRRSDFDLVTEPSTLALSVYVTLLLSRFDFLPRRSIDLLKADKRQISTFTSSVGASRSA